MITDRVAPLPTSPTIHSTSRRSQPLRIAPRNFVERPGPTTATYQPVSWTPDMTNWAAMTTQSHQPISLEPRAVPDLPKNRNNPIFPPGTVDPSLIDPRLLQHRYSSKDPIQERYPFPALPQEPLPPPNPTGRLTSPFVPQHSPIIANASSVATCPTPHGSINGYPRPAPTPPVGQDDFFRNQLNAPVFISTESSPQNSTAIPVDQLSAYRTALAARTVPPSVQIPSAPTTSIVPPARLDGVREGTSNVNTATGLLAGAPSAGPTVNNSTTPAAAIPPEIEFSDEVNNAAQLLFGLRATQPAVAPDVACQTLPPPADSKIFSKTKKPRAQPKPKPKSATEPKAKAKPKPKPKRKSSATASDSSLLSPPKKVGRTTQNSLRTQLAEPTCPPASQNPARVRFRSEDSVREFDRLSPITSSPPSTPPSTAASALPSPPPTLKNPLPRRPTVYTRKKASNDPGQGIERPPPPLRAHLERGERSLSPDSSDDEQVLLSGSTDGKRAEQGERMEDRSLMSLISASPQNRALLKEKAVEVRAENVDEAWRRWAEVTMIWASASRFPTSAIRTTLLCDSGPDDEDMTEADWECASNLSIALEELAAE
ncbi:uncharacterized protein MKK02DRAFT_44902 [Dioszegia hungarica]|uniref:Uncharacterized protein n=1 Tax=Dioszegia hungarica TaxID=4972 RepID=A0AA38H937_9TREE|nr:uncharacterized protein MKK02DRAFT_44902 [Dioszegia hungarica]KAI9636198.1 hypothetical protein MKK02DRAFT_44902 [Dioszegia hungarica]